jgi:hypothetical protein
MRKYILAFALVAVAAPAIQATVDETEHVNRTLRMDPGGTLRLKNFSGRVTITASDLPEVVIDAVRRAPRERLARIRLDIRTDGPNVVVVDANSTPTRLPRWGPRHRRDRFWFELVGGKHVVETDFDIKVPRRTNLNISVFSSPVTVEGIEGSHKVHSFSARLSLNDVVGPIRAHTFSGAVVIRERSWEPNQTIDVDTFSGNVELHVPESARASVSFNSFSGRLNSEMPLTLHNSSRRSVRADLGGGGGGRLRFKTFSGSVRIDR